MKVTYRFALVGVAAAAAFGMAAVPAGASTVRHVVTHHSSSSATVRGARGGLRITANPTSPTIAGAIGEPSNGIISITSTFTAPTFACAKTNDVEDFAVGPYVYDSDGNTDVAGYVQFVCEDGATDYNLGAYTTVGGNYYANVVSPGDTITVSITESAVSGNTTATAIDLTTGVSESSTQANGADGSSDVAFNEGVLTYYPHIPTFTSIKQSECLVNGFPLNEETLELANLEVKTTVQVKTDPVTGSSVEVLFKSNK